MKKNFSAYLKKIARIPWKLFFYDAVILAFVELLLLGLYGGPVRLSPEGILCQSLLTLFCVSAARILGGAYRQVWRYGGIQCYILLLVVDGAAFFCNVLFEAVLPMERVTFPRLLSVCCMNLLGALAIRMVYRYAYKCGGDGTLTGRALALAFRIFAGRELTVLRADEARRINIAIIGAGRVGVALAEELLGNASSEYRPQCFVDIDERKTNKTIHGLAVLSEDENTMALLRARGVQEVVFALPRLSEDRHRSLCDRYLTAGFKIKVYDYPIMQGADERRHMRDFDIQELLFRRPVVMQNERTTAYYRDKVILITGGGGSIGSELCRQLAKLAPRRVVILDIYENGAYDIQQELRIAYDGRLEVAVEILSITNERGLARIFEAHRPHIVINAAAHKHVPLMEHNVIEAVENNVFGTLNLVTLCERYGVERFMMVSTDKAVNPTNVMGATKRMCEMLVQSAAMRGRVKYSATRFGNVLGSAGSVIPLFRRQVASGGPITLTDKRIVRYFMTIPEAAGLVLESGAMANNGELFVLDMGQPVRILELAEGMIRLSGMRGIEIVETGLRPGEKLYEELLIKTEELDKTDNSLIFIERGEAFSEEEIAHKLAVLKEACATGDDEAARRALYSVVPTFRPAEEVNAEAEQAHEMQEAKTIPT